MGIVLASFIPEPVLAGAVTFVPVFAMFSVNLVATELEMPFGDGPNDLPLHHFQDEMNLSLMMLIHDKADRKPWTRRDVALMNSDLRETMTQVDIDSVMIERI